MGHIPDSIGPYNVLDVLGEGAVGTVYLAENVRGKEPRQVAIKLIRLGMDTRELLARFKLERNVLAAMEHPNVARVFDAGETRLGRPYIVMEYVPGEPITTYCDARRLSIRERLGLFAKTCRAVQHAHQRGILHRDIKPSNVLVHDQDGEHVPVVIDFGLAKVMQPEAADQSALTQPGQILGTPQYMSPEQVELAPEDIDTRSDVYSLGLMLFELIVGERAYERRFTRTAVQEFVESVRNEEPSRPSTKLSQSAERAAEIAARRATDVATLRKQVRGDLDWIALRAIEHDRERRYPSALELAEDVERLLREETVRAHPPSAAYRLERFVARNRTAAYLAIALVFAIVVGSGASTFWYLRAGALRADSAAAIRACFEVRDEVGDAHLWFEEALADDASVSLEDDVYRRLRWAQELVGMLRTGGVAPFGRIEPVAEPEATDVLAGLDEQLDELLAITSERWTKRRVEGAAGGATGSVLDQRYDALYASVLDGSFAVVQHVEEAVADEWSRSARAGIAVNLMALAVVALSVLLVVRARAR